MARRRPARSTQLKPALRAKPAPATSKPASARANPAPAPAPPPAKPHTRNAPRPNKLTQKHEAPSLYAEDADEASDISEVIVLKTPEKRRKRRRGVGREEVVEHAGGEDGTERAGEGGNAGGGRDGGMQVQGLDLGHAEGLLPSSISVKKPAVGMAYIELSTNSERPVVRAEREAGMPGRGAGGAKLQAPGDTAGGLHQVHLPPSIPPSTNHSPHSNPPTTHPASTTPNLNRPRSPSPPARRARPTTRLPSKIFFVPDSQEEPTLPTLLSPSEASLVRRPCLTGPSQRWASPELR